MTTQTKQRITHTLKYYSSTGTPRSQPVKRSVLMVLMKPRSIGYCANCGGEIRGKAWTDMSMPIRVCLECAPIEADNAI